MFTDLGGFDGDGDATDVPALDAASADAPSGTPTDGSDSSAAGDGGTMGDAPTEAGPCGASFCDDFDTPPFGAKWTGKVETGGTVVGDSKAMLASMSSTTGETLRQAFLYKRFDMPKAMSCTFAVHPVDLSGATEVFSFSVSAPGYKSFSLWLALRTASTELGVAAEREDGGTVYDTRGVPLVGAGKWTTITMATDFTKLALSEDGTVVKDEAFFPAVVPTRVDMQAGITFQYSTLSSSIRVDDVRCTVTN